MLEDRPRDVNPDLLISNPTKLSQVGSTREPFIHHSWPRFERWGFTSLSFFAAPFSSFRPRGQSRSPSPFSARVHILGRGHTRPSSAAPQGPLLNERLLTPWPSLFPETRARRGVTNGVPAAFWPVECRTTPHAARLIGSVIVSSVGETKRNRLTTFSPFI